MDEHCTEGEPVSSEGNVVEGNIPEEGLGGVPAEVEEPDICLESILSCI